MKKFFFFPAFAFFILLSLSCIFLKTSPPIAFDWPLQKNRLTQRFSSLKSPPHLGIDLSSPLGAPVLSAYSGRVVYAGKRLSGYGSAVIVEHPQSWASLYAHLQSIKVKRGQKIRRGEIIGTVGKTGRASGPHLHFELIYKKKAVNPLVYLP